MPRGIPKKPRSPRPETSLGLVKPVARIEDKLDRLIEAQTALIQALNEVLVRASTTAAAANTPLKPFAGFGGADQAMGKPGSIFVPRGTLAEAGAGGVHALPQPSLDNAARLAGPLGEVDLDAPIEGDVALDPVASLYDELASYTEEDETPPPPLDEAELWGKRLHTWRANRLWMPDWGPRPGQPDCQVPPYLMNGR